MKLVLQPPENLGSAGRWDSWARRRTAGVVVPHQGAPTTTRDPTGPLCRRTPASRWLRYRSSQYPDIPPLSALPAQSWRSLMLNFQVVGALKIDSAPSAALGNVGAARERVKASAKLVQVRRPKSTFVVKSRAKNSCALIQASRSLALTSMWALKNE